MFYIAVLIQQTKKKILILDQDNLMGTIVEKESERVGRYRK